MQQEMENTSALHPANGVLRAQPMRGRDFPLNYADPLVQNTTFCAGGSSAAVGCLLEAATPKKRSLTTCKLQDLPRVKSYLLLRFCLGGPCFVAERLFLRRRGDQELC